MHQSRIAFDIEQRNPLAIDVFVVDAGCVDLPKGCYANARNLTDDDSGLFIQPAWSPDGSRIAYAYRSTPDPTTSFDVWVMNADGSNRVRLTDFGGSRPSWSPDGQLIAFESCVKGEQWNAPEGESMGGCSNVFIMNADGSNVRRLTTLLPDSEMPAWSPDGQQIAVISAEGQDLFAGHYTHVYVVSADGSQVQRLTGGERHGVSPAWSPDGTQLVYARDGHDVGLFLVNVDGSGTTQLTDQEGDGSPAWAP